MTVGHVLLDADGVVQSIPGGQWARAQALLGDRSLALLEEVFVDELPALCGRGDFLVDLRAAFERHGIAVDVDVFYGELWNAIEVSPDTVAVVHRLRAAGYGVHLGTNQHRQRAAYMREHLGYDELFDVSCYSCELGVAKPDPAYFERAVTLIGAPASTVLFVDDNAANVDGARAAGLSAEQWELGRGTETLLALLRRHGVALDGE